MWPPSWLPIPTSPPSSIPSAAAWRSCERGWSLRHYVSFSGMVTFKNWRLGRRNPGDSLDRLLLETDGPYLAPVPQRGKRNEPGFVRHVAERVASRAEYPDSTELIAVNPSER